jgi:ribulose-phosphate 3-epimerase
VGSDNIADVAAAGADTFVAGSAIFKAANYKAVVEQMRTSLATVS